MSDTKAERRLAIAEEILRLWVTPINWEDGSAEIERRLIEGKLRLLEDTRIFLAQGSETGAPVGEETR